MESIEELLLEENLSFEDIKIFIEEKNKENYYKILHRINVFNEDSQKKICKEIIKRADNENIVDRACMEIITFIKYDYDYYKEIIEEVAEKEYHSTWIDVIKDKLIEDNANIIQHVFEDFSREIPSNIHFDIEIINSILNKYEKKHIENLNIGREQAIVVCSRLNCIMTINLINVLNIYYEFDNKFKFSELEIGKFLEKFFFDFPYICKKFIEKNSYDENLNIIKYIKNRLKRFDKEEKMKFNMKIFHPDVRRLNQFRKYQLEQNKEINKNARKHSVILNLCKPNTILYGKRYGITITTKEEKKVSIGNMQQLKYEYPYPLSYIMDPVEYMIRINSLKILGKEA